jgi:glycosidase
MTPDWVKSLVLTEVHLETATPEGTFDAAVRVLDHLADLGVNGIWLTPIYEKGPGGNGYGNIGPHTVEPALCPNATPGERWDAVRRFVAAAHERRIRVLFDIVTWGTVTAAPLFREHPEWYRGRAWGNEAFDWTNPAFCEWFISVAVGNLLYTGADGYRCDCEPNYAGYAVWEEVRRRCLEAGRKVLIMAEDGAERRFAFDMEQDGVLWYADRDRGGQYRDPVNFYLEKLNIVDSVKTSLRLGTLSDRAVLGGSARKADDHGVSGFKTRRHALLRTDRERADHHRRGSGARGKIGGRGPVIRKHIIFTGSVQGVGFRMELS